MNSENRSHKVPKLGIIIPVGDSEVFIRDFCSQYFASIDGYSGEIETIFVTNNSTNNCLKMLNEFARRDVSIYDLGECSHGISKARNYGLDQLSDDVDYVSFLDDDDALNSSCFESLIKELEAGFDIVCFEWTVVTNRLGDTARVRLPRTSVVKPEVIFRDDLPKYLNLPRDMQYLGRCWAKVYKRTLIENEKMRFDESISTFEDVLFLLHAVEAAETIRFSTLNFLTQNYIKKPMTQKATFGNSRFEKSLGYISVANYISYNKNINFRFGRYGKSELLSRYCGYLFFFSVINFYRANRLTGLVSSLKRMRKAYKATNHYSHKFYFLDKNSGESVIIGNLYKFGFLSIAIAVCYMKNFSKNILGAGESV